MSLERQASLRGEWLGQTSLHLPENLTYEEWHAIGEVLNAAEQSVQWWIGDWLNYGERRWGDKYNQAALETGRTHGTLRNYASIARKFDLSRRRDKLPWSHHAAVAALPVDEREKWLDRAESEDWSEGELRGRLRNKAPDEAIVSMTKGRMAALELAADEATKLREENERLKSQASAPQPEPKAEPTFAKPQPSSRPRPERVYVDPDTVGSFKQTCENLSLLADEYPDDWNPMTKGDFRKNLEALNEMAKGFLA